MVLNYKLSSEVIFSADDIVSHHSMQIRIPPPKGSKNIFAGNTIKLSKTKALRRI